MTTFLPPVSHRRNRANRAHSVLPLATEQGPICSRTLAIAGLILVAGIVLFYRLGTARTFSSHEIYAVVPAREMIKNQNWVLPTFGEVPRLRKPPLAYWVVAGSATVFGELSPITARIPSAFAGLMLAGVLGVWAGRWYGSRVGWTAVFVQLTSAWVLIFARKAEIDMLLCLFTTSALFLIVNQPKDEKPGLAFWRWIAVYGLLSLSWMAKFHYGPAMVLAPVGVFFLIERRWQVLKSWAHPLGFGMFAAAVFVWPWLVLQQTPEAWDVWRGETIGRAVGELGTKSFATYLPFLVWMPLPWTFFAWVNIPQSWQAAWKQRDARERFLWIWCAVHLAILFLSANKHGHYLLAMMPMMTLFAARGLSDTLYRFRNGDFRISRNGTAVMVGLNIALCGVMVFILLKIWPAIQTPTWVLGFLLAVGESLGWIFLYRRQILGVMTTNILCLVLAGIVVTGWYMPASDRRVGVQNFAAGIRENLLPNQPVCVFGMDRDPMVYHLGAPVFRRESVEELQSELNKQSPLYVVGYERFINELSTIGDTNALARLPKGKKGFEPVEGNMLLVKLTARPKT